MGSALLGGDEDCWVASACGFDGAGTATDADDGEPCSDVNSELRNDFFPASQLRRQRRRLLQVVVALERLHLRREMRPQASRGTHPSCCATSPAGNMLPHCAHISEIPEIPSHPLEPRPLHVHVVQQRPGEVGRSCRLAFCRLAFCRLASRRSAPCRYACVMFAPLIFAPLRLAIQRLHRSKVRPAQFVWVMLNN